MVLALDFKLAVINVEVTKIIVSFCLDKIFGIIALFIAVKAGDLGNKLILASILTLILVFFLYGSNVELRDRGIIFLSIITLHGIV